MTRINDYDFAQIIITTLREMQELLIKRRSNGRCEGQSIVPTVNITDRELRKLSGRTRIKSAFITNLIAYLEDEDMEVEHDHESGMLTVTCPAEDIIPEFNSLKALKAQIDVLRDVWSLKEKIEKVYPPISTVNWLQVGCNDHNFK